MSKLVGILTLTLSATFLGIALNDDASAQQKTLREQLIGSWMLVSSDNYSPDGTRRPTFGPNGKGSLILAADGHYTQIQVDPDRPKFKSGNRLTGTSEENTIAVKGTTASFGTWSVDEATQALTYHVDGALYPNAQGGTERRVVILNGDEMKYVNKGGPGGSYGEVIYRRVK